LQILRPSIFNKFPEVVAALSTRTGGVSPPPLGMNLSFGVGDLEENVRRNREQFFSAIGIRLSEIAVPQQVHSATVIRADRPGRYPECDALLTDCERLFLCVTFADCVPLLLYDPRKRSIASVHAGWRGTVSMITRFAVEALCREFGTRPEHVEAFIGPAASDCCYTVGGDVAAQFDQEFVRRDGERFHVDLKRANLQQLMEAGVPPEQVEVSSYCTISDADLFHSHRREKEKSGRMMAVIGFPGSLPPD
jgi:YfiH family protein